ncbi:MAG TPA: HDOD domain-containing protein [Tepidisphaeraceae bacterium]|nr:HDOD domain-containing protein [Tepidisphaeraceae bacterium]
MSQMLVEKIRSFELLPSPPALAMLVMELVREDAPVAEIAELISQDSALSAKLLKTANSSFYRRSHTVSTIAHATILLGLKTVRTLVLGFSLVSRLQTRKTKAFDYQKFWRRNLYAATAARALAGKMNLIQREEAFLAGLLADIGMLALDAVYDGYADICRGARSHAELAEIEVQLLDMTHADASGLLARQWKLPAMLAIPMGSHHRPETATDSFGQQMAEIVRVGGLCADVYVQDHSAEALLEARETCFQKFALPQRDCDLILIEVAAAALEAAPLFEVPIHAPADLVGIQVKAAQLAIPRALATGKSLPNKALAPNKAVA